MRPQTLILNIFNSIEVTATEIGTILNNELGEGRFLNINSLSIIK